MSRSQRPAPRRRFPWIPILGGLVLLGVVLTAGGFAYAASRETHDVFCASCHTQPETTFYQRTLTTTPVSLASFHSGKETRCINCHSGAGVTGRIRAELIGARNAFKWYTGTAVQPAVMTYPITDGNCLKCHQDVTQRSFVPKEQISIPTAGGGFGEGEGFGEREGGRNNHWHEFMSRWQAASMSAGSCVSCHASHPTDGTAQNGFMTAQNVQAICNACHQVLREREGGE